MFIELNEVIPNSSTFAYYHQNMSSLMFNAVQITAAVNCSRVYLSALIAPQTDMFSITKIVQDRVLFCKYLVWFFMHNYIFNTGTIF